MLQLQKIVRMGKYMSFRVLAAAILLLVGCNPYAQKNIRTACDLLSLDEINMTLGTNFTQMGNSHHGSTCYYHMKEGIEYAMIENINYYSSGAALMELKSSSSIPYVVTDSNTNKQVSLPSQKVPVAGNYAYFIYVEKQHPSGYSHLTFEFVLDSHLITVTVLGSRFDQIPEKLGELYKKVKQNYERM